MYYFNLVMVMFDGLCNFGYGYVQMENAQNCGFFCMNYEQRFVKDRMDGHDASFVYLVVKLIIQMQSFDTSIILLWQTLKGLR